MLRQILVVTAALVLAACGASGQPPPITTARAEPARKPAHPRRPPLDPDVVERARQPFHGARTGDPATLTQTAVLDALSAADVVCVGEGHDDPAHHFVQLAVLEHLAVRAAQTARRLGVGLEMVARQHQPALDRYAQKTLDEAGLAQALAWDDSWGFDFALYRPLFETARRVGADLVALNASRTTVHAVAKEGLSGLPDRERKSLPPLDLESAEHRAAFDRAMKGHPTTGPSMDNLYAAQVLWDETMAATAADWLSQGRSARQMLILAGSGHCHETAIVQRVERRVPVDAIAVRIVSPTDPQEAEAPRVDYSIVLEGQVSGAAEP